MIISRGNAPDPNTGNSPRVHSTPPHLWNRGTASDEYKHQQHEVKSDLSDSSSTPGTRTGIAQPSPMSYDAYAWSHRGWGRVVRNIACLHIKIFTFNSALWYDSKRKINNHWVKTFHSRKYRKKPTLTYAHTRKYFCMELSWADNFLKCISRTPSMTWNKCTVLQQLKHQKLTKFCNLRIPGSYSTVTPTLSLIIIFNNIMLWFCVFAFLCSVDCLSYVGFSHRSLYGLRFMLLYLCILCNVM